MEKKESNIDYSVFESEEMQMKVGRIAIETEALDSTNLANKILEDGYDLCRLKISAEEENTIEELEKLDFPFYFSASIRRYKTPVEELTVGTFINQGIEYEKYDRPKDDLLYQMLDECWGDYPMGYYRTPYLKELISKKQELECVFRYYKKYNLQSDFPNNTIMFMKHNGRYVGFFALNVIGDRLESHIGGILKAYQKYGYFYDMQEYIRRFCVDNHLKYFCFGARNENSRVQSIFQKFGYKATITENIFHIVPLLSASKVQNITSSLVIEHETSLEKHQLLLQFFNSNERINELMPNFKSQEFKTNNINALVKGIYSITISVPIITDELLWSSLKVSDSANKIVCSALLIRKK